MRSGKKIKVLIIDDSNVARMFLSHIIESDPQLEVVGCIKSGKEALNWLQVNSCDVITMDIYMPDLDGFEVTKRIMESIPIPTIIISSGYTESDKSLAFKAIEVGALAIFEKPFGLEDINYEQKKKEIIETIKTISGLKVITRHHKKLPKETKISTYELSSEKNIEAIGIGASLGGPIAIAQILKELPSSFPVPIFIVQHIVPGFTKNFAQWLQGQSKLHVAIATHGEIAKPSCVYIAPDGCQMEIKAGGVISLNSDTPLERYAPINSLFKSMAKTYNSHCVGVILTGMGKDGTAGLLSMKQNGAITLAQNEESSLIFGMAKEAISSGSVSQVLPLDVIASTLNALVTQKKREQHYGRG